MSIPPVEVLDELSAVWGIPLQPFGCPDCKQIYLALAGQINFACPICGCGSLSPQPAWLRPAAPELLLPFSPSLSLQITNELKKFVDEVWIKPDDFNLSGLTQRLRPIYWTQWLADSQLDGQWKAEAGYDYQVKSSQEFYGNGGWSTRELVETRIRWEARLGQIKRAYQNIPAPGFSRQKQLLAMIGSYDTRPAVAYSHSAVGTAPILVPDLQPEEVWETARTAFNQAAAADVQKACSAPHLRNFFIDAAYAAPNWTQLLLPIYVTGYTDDDGKYHPIFIHGQTGRIAGVRMASQKKGWQWAAILGAGCLAALLAGLICFLGAALFPPAAILGIIFIVAAIGLGIAAIFPAASPWQWNRRQQENPWFTPSNKGA